MINDLNNFLIKYFETWEESIFNEYEKILTFAKDLTLEEFLQKCQRGDWILFLFKILNPDSLNKLTLAKIHCANLGRELLRDQENTQIINNEENIKIIDEASNLCHSAICVKLLENKLIELCNKLVGKCEESMVYFNALAYRASGEVVIELATDYSWEIWRSIDCCMSRDALSVGAEEDVYKQTADICRQHLPIQIWNKDFLTK